MKANLKNIISLLCILYLLNGCAAAIIGGGAAAASVAVDRRTTGTVIEDEAIELKASQKINENQELREQSHVNVTSYNTHVLVTGEAPTEAMKQQIIDIITNIPKVQHVYDELRVAAPSAMLARSSDGVVTTKLKTKLLTNENTQGLHVKVVTENGVVYLMGLVSRAEGDAATEVARTTGGVEKVVKLFQYQE